MVWLRRDLRLSDQPALQAAFEHGGPVIPVFVWSPEEEGRWAAGAASRWWLHHSLKNLRDDLARVGSPLMIRRGPSLDELLAVLSESGAERLFWNRSYEPATIARDTFLKQALRERGYHVESFNGSLLVEPWELLTNQQGPYQVFTPFWKAFLSRQSVRAPLPAVRQLSAPSKSPRFVSLDSLGLLPRRNWADGFSNLWQPGEKGALRKLAEFCNRITHYGSSRDFPAEAGTSQLSPHLHWGEISPQTVWKEVQHAGRQLDCGATRRTDSIERNRDDQSSEDQLHADGDRGDEVFLREVGWREFAHHLLFHFPQTPETPLRTKFQNFPWRSDAEQLRCWQRGLTGYPIVDAGMRQLWATGWMHNRVRMIVASFLTKDLQMAWQSGAEWFWDTLVDANLANNTLGWQWSAGCGADAAPYFRIFNPRSQSEKFDPRGVYIRQWVPEIARLPDRYLHEPSSASTATLQKAGVELVPHPCSELFLNKRLSETSGSPHEGIGKMTERSGNMFPVHQTGRYPLPIVDHAEARKNALAAFATIKMQ